MFGIPLDPFLSVSLPLIRCSSPVPYLHLCTYLPPFWLLEHQTILYVVRSAKRFGAQMSLGNMDELNSPVCGLLVSEP